MPKYQVKQRGIVNHRMRERLEVVELSAYVAGYYADNLIQVEDNVITGFHKELLPEKGCEDTTFLSENDDQSKNKAKNSRGRAQKATALADKSAEDEAWAVLTGGEDE